MICCRIFPFLMLCNLQAKKQKMVYFFRHPEGYNNCPTPTSTLYSTRDDNPCIITLTVNRLQRLRTVRTSYIVSDIDCDVFAQQSFNGAGVAAAWSMLRLIWTRPRTSQELPVDLARCSGEIDTTP